MATAIDSHASDGGTPPPQPARTPAFPRTDTQKDMAFALIGAITAQLLLGKLHDRQLERITPA